jgi:hypothetical protein
MKEKFLNFLGSIFDFVFEKHFTSVLITIGIAFFSMIFYIANDIEKEKAKMYCVKVERTKYWTRDITFNQNGSLSFVDVESKRPYTIYGDNYIIAQPKVKSDIKSDIKK